MIRKMDLRTYIDDYIQKSLKNKGKLQKAAKVSSSEIVARVEDFCASPNPQTLIMLLRGLTTSGVYISRSFLRFLFVHIDFKKAERPGPTDKEREIFHKVLNKEAIDNFQAGPREIFHAILNNLLELHESADYNPQRYLSEFSTTIVLVSGVLNEIFSNAAFERGAQHLSEVFGSHYISPKVYGTKSVSHNSKLLEEQLVDYIDHNPDEKLWLIGFSKGGLDCLHFLRSNPSFAEKHIQGLSTIASPILGADHLNNKVLKTINSIHKFSDNQIYKFFEKQYDVLFNEFQNSISQEKQKSWFFKNHKKLPMLNFYSALALEAHWNESHFWMILTKAFFQNKKINDGVVIAENALFPSYFDSHNFGIIKGHHLIGTRSSTFNQEALLEAHVLYLQYQGLLN